MEPGYSTRSLALHNTLQAWWGEEGLNDKYVPSVKALNARLAEMGIDSIRKTVDGRKIALFDGIRVRDNGDS